jgi:hypothetical protein
MMSDDNDHLEQNDHQVKLYKHIYFNGTTDLAMVPINVFLQSVHMRKLVVCFALYQEDTGLGGKGGERGGQ